MLLLEWGRHRIVWLITTTAEGRASAATIIAAGMRASLHSPPAHSPKSGWSGSTKTRKEQGLTKRFWLASRIATRSDIEKWSTEAPWHRMGVASDAELMRKAAEALVGPGLLGHMWERKTLF